MSAQNSLKVQNLKLQKRLAASVLNCGRNKVWMDPNEISEIATAKTRQAVKKLAKDNVITKKPNKMHSRARARKFNEARAKGRHMGAGNREGAKGARSNSKRVWITRIRVLRRLLKKYRDQRKIDKHLYRELYMKAKGFQFKAKKQLMEYIWKAKAENARLKADAKLADARRAHFKALRARKMERHELRMKARTGVYLAAAEEKAVQKPVVNKKAAKRVEQAAQAKEKKAAPKKAGEKPKAEAKKDAPAKKAAPAKAAPAKKK